MSAVFFQGKESCQGCRAKDVQIEALKKGYHNLRKGYDNLKKENENLRKGYDNLKKENENLKKENISLKKDFNNLKKENVILKAENVTLKAENKKTYDKLNSLEKRFEEHLRTCGSKKKARSRKPVSFQSKMNLCDLYCNIL